MLVCTSCWSPSSDTATRCETCGASLLGITAAQNSEHVRSWRERRRRRSHMITGIILCFGLPTLFGLPSTLMPGEILKSLVFGVVFGAPLGYCVSRFADSTLGGAAIGCGIGILYCIVTMTLAGAPVTVVTVLLGIGTGLLPGAIMGLHVSLDR
jgi:hypothetical protein